MYQNPYQQYSQSLFQRLPQPMFHQQQYFNLNFQNSSIRQFQSKVSGRPLSLIQSVSPQNFASVQSQFIQPRSLRSHETTKLNQNKPDQKLNSVQKHAQPVQQKQQRSQDEYFPSKTEMQEYSRMMVEIIKENQDLKSEIQKYELDVSIAKANITKLQELIQYLLSKGKSSNENNQEKPEDVDQQSY